mgnify:CR=1 FL=1
MPPGTLGATAGGRMPSGAPEIAAPEAPTSAPELATGEHVWPRAPEAATLEAPASAPEVAVRGPATKGHAPTPRFASSEPWRTPQEERALEL